VESHPVSICHSLLQSMASLKVVLYAALAAAVQADCITVHDEDGHSQCVEQPDFVQEMPERSLLSMRVSDESPLATKAETESGASTISAKNCFKAYCKSSTVKKQLITYCKSQKKYKNCDGLTYHDTFTKNKLNKKATYTFKGGIKYDEKHAKTKPYSVTGLEGYWDNDQSVDDIKHLDRKIGRSSTVSWATTTSFQFSEELSIEVTEKIPEVAEEKTGIKAGFQVGTSSSTSQSHSTSQDYSVSETINIAHKKCTKYCVYEQNNQYEVPYSLTGEYKGAGELKSSNAFMCCYTRPGGDSSCSWGGHGSGGTGTYGWMAEDTAGAAVSWASKQGHDTCPQLSASGSSAKFSLPGKFVGGLKTTSNVETFEKGVGKCRNYKCPNRSGASGINNEPEGESTVIAV